MNTIVEVSHYLPIGTTILSAIFVWQILQRYKRKSGAYHLLWWGLGVAIYGLGTLVESLTTLLGWHVVLFKAWYISGALLGGAPLALGTVYLLLSKRAGHISLGVLVAAVAITSVFVMLSPINYDLVENEILSSKVLEWQSIRIVSPFINSLAFLFLVGGAIYSAIRFIGNPASRNVAYGNILIAIGATLPGVGGIGSRMGHTELLYIGELIGVILIWLGYRTCQKPAIVAEPAPARQ